jgi:S-DNA-T family DNA segregation ATPase FtsK/SpoIIIE
MAEDFYWPAGPAGGNQLTNILLLLSCVGVPLVAYKIGRFLGRLALRHRITATIVAVYLIGAWLVGAVEMAGFMAGLAVDLVIFRFGWPTEFRRYVAEPLRRSRRRGWYRAYWEWLTVGHGLAVVRPHHRLMGGVRHVTALPRRRRIRTGQWVDRITFRPLVGQAIDQWEKACDAMALAMGATGCRIAADRPGLLRLEVIWGDPLEMHIPALDIPADVDLAAVPVGLRENGEPWTLRLTENHLLLAGVMGAGKSSVLWSLLRALAVRIHAGTVVLWGLDPKGGMEFQPGRALFTRFAAGDPLAMVQLLEQAVAEMAARAGRYAEVGVRKHVATLAEPLIVLVIDEMAFLTAYVADNKVRDRANKALATLLTQGRAVGVCVVAALQDPRKDVIAYRNLFPTKVGMRLDEKLQVDMVLGDGARDAGARCDQIPDSTPGVAFVKVDGIREPVRVRAGYVTDDDIASTAATYPAPGERAEGLRVVA